MTLADTDLPLDPALKTAMLNRLQTTNNFTYKVNSQQYYEAIANWYKDRHIKESNVDLKPEYILESPSLMNMFYIAVQHFAKEGDKVMAFTPVWTAYRETVTYLGRTFVECRMQTTRVKGQSRYDINWEELEHKVKDCKILVICNPHNPSGRAWTEQEVKRVLALC